MNQNFILVDSVCKLNFLLLQFVYIGQGKFTLILHSALK